MHFFEGMKSLQVEFLVVGRKIFVLDCECFGATLYFERYFVFEVCFGVVMAVVVPRNFKLLDEYDCSIGKEGKSKISGKHDGYIHYGLDEERDDNHFLHHWRASIIGPQEV